MRFVLASLAVSLVALTSLASAGCASGPRCDVKPPAVVHVPTPPPAPLTDAEFAAPTPGMEHIKGYWHWDGVRWVWIPTHWLTAPAGQRWHAAEYGHGTYREGAWGCE